MGQVRRRCLLPLIIDTLVLNIYYGALSVSLQQKKHINQTQVIVTDDIRMIRFLLLNSSSICRL